MDMSMGVLDVSGRGRLWSAHEHVYGRAGLSGRGRVDDQGVLNVSGRGILRSAHGHSTGVLGHSELVGARDGYRNMKIFGRDESRTTHLAHPVKY